MESVNKQKISEDQLKTIVSHAFNQSYEYAKELSDGWANMAYSILLDDGRTVVLKIAPSKDKLVMRCERNNMRTEVEVLMLVGQTERLPVPRIYTYDPSCSLIPSEYFFMEHIVGTPLKQIRSSLTPEELVGIELQLGIYSRWINSYQGTQFGYYHQENGWRDTWPEAFLMMIDDVLTDGKEAGVILPVSYSLIESEISRNMHALNEVTEACLVDWDLWDGNIFIHEGQISGIIDFERAFWGEPLIEYYFGRFARTEAFEQGYGRTDSTDLERRRRALYDLYFDLILVIECSYRKYENLEHIKWTYENFSVGFENLRNI